MDRTREGHGPHGRRPPNKTNEAATLLEIIMLTVDGVWPDLMSDPKTQQVAGSPLNHRECVYIYIFNELMSMARSDSNMLVMGFLTQTMKT